ncbi:MAG: DUF2283 domain-containing protein [Candidatus Woykebacteria bacterium]
MELKYYKEDDILVMKFSNNPVDDSFEVDDNAVLEVSKDNEPVTLEVLHASKFFNSINKVLPKEVKEEFFTPV